jgi:plastocyanin
VLLVVGVAACGSDDDSSSGDATTTTTTTGAGGAEEYVVVAKDFSLTDLTVEPGEEFTLDNQGDSTHTLTADDGSFDSGEIAPGEQSDLLTPPDEPGEYPFHCEIHSSMKATLTVEG